MELILFPHKKRNERRPKPRVFKSVVCTILKIRDSLDHSQAAWNPGILQMSAIDLLAKLIVDFVAQGEVHIAHLVDTSTQHREKNHVLRNASLPAIFHDI
jgi:hypothetical protein